MTRFAILNTFLKYGLLIVAAIFYWISIPFTLVWKAVSGDKSGGGDSQSYWLEADRTGKGDE